MAGDAAIDEGAIAPIVGFLLLNQEAADAFGIGVLGFYMSESMIRQGRTPLVLLANACIFRDRSVPFAFRPLIPMNGIRLRTPVILSTFV